MVTQPQPWSKAAVGVAELFEMLFSLLVHRSKRCQQQWSEENRYTLRMCTRRKRREVDEAAGQPVQDLYTVKSGYNDKNL